MFDDAENAIKREKRLKKWNRAWKIRLIEENNPNWEDLYPGIAGLHSLVAVIPREGGVSSTLRR